MPLGPFFSIPSLEEPWKTPEKVRDYHRSARSQCKPFAPAPAVDPAPRSGELIPILAAQIAGSQVNAVNARDLHQFLEVGKVFGAWISERIEAYEFQEHRDFEICFPNLESKGRGGHNAKEYMLSLEMAKELSMVERNAKGKQARAYFIECERRAQVQRVPQTLPEALRLAAELAEQRAALECRVQVLEPKAQGLDRISATEVQTFTNSGLGGFPPKGGKP